MGGVEPGHATASMVAVPVLYLGLDGRRGAWPRDRLDGGSARFIPGWEAWSLATRARATASMVAVPVLYLGLDGRRGAWPLGPERPPRWWQCPFYTWVWMGGVEPGH
ncbi:hypothetical protein JTE90_017040 [Oedothorax gibbosus]|uniref:Uncharacterized protein n=1 Tax=Oedothorax gibbosus TaxID=931172 RepID=A0AAV6UL98_9ARAC|nr:hypothetical protein JTE90_017040 [Oedothorax gibbosus]